jgi:hypothetical protein
MESRKIGGGLFLVLASATPAIMAAMRLEIPTAIGIVGLAICLALFILGGVLVLAPRRPILATGDERTLALGRFIQAGHGLQNWFMQSEDTGEMQRREVEWASEVTTYLRSAVGEAQAIQFEVATANPMDGQPSGKSDRDGFFYARITARNRLLTQYMLQAQNG